MAQRLSIKRRSCARALCFRIPMLREVAGAGAALRRSGCGRTVFRLCLEWISARSDKWLATAIASHFFLSLGATEFEDSYADAISHLDPPAGVLELPRAHQRYPFLSGLRQGAASPGS